MKRFLLSFIMVFVACAVGYVKADGMSMSATGGSGAPDAPIARVTTANTIAIDAAALPPGQSLAQVIAITGTVMMSLPVDSDNLSLNPDLDNRPKGYYLVRALPSGNSTGQKVKSQKIVVK